MYRVWIMSTLYGLGSASHGQRATGASSETQKAFLQKYTSQELIQISKASRFLQSLAGWVILAECKVVGSLDVCQSAESFLAPSFPLLLTRTTYPLTDDFHGLYLFAGPHIILRCYEEQSSDPLPFSYLFNEEVYEDFLLPSAEGILSQRNITIPLAFMGSILDDVCGAHDTC